MGITLDEFQVLSGPDQRAAVYATGTFVSRRWQEVDEAGRRYRMPGGFFAELTDKTTRQQVLYPGSFGADEWDKREDYALFVRLPEGFPRRNTRLCARTRCSPGDPQKPNGRS